MKTLIAALFQEEGEFYNIEIPPETEAEIEKMKQKIDSMSAGSQKVCHLVP